tara:strand:- start:212 stop:559 length:348 start_codon:yes stop_codon:yes gene_type:complete
MTAGTYLITAEQGATFTRTIVWKDSAGVPVDLTGYTARMQVREDYFSTVAELTLTTANGKITLGGVTGSIVLNVSATDMALLQANSYVYDLELEIGGVVTRLIQGTFTVNAEVTR